MSRMLKVLAPLGLLIAFTSIAVATTDRERDLLAPYADTLERLCRDAMEDESRCDAIGAALEVAVGDDRRLQCADMDALVRGCEDEQVEGDVACRLFEAVADDVCEDGGREP